MRRWREIVVVVVAGLVVGACSGSDAAEVAPTDPPAPTTSVVDTVTGATEVDVTTPVVTDPAVTVPPTAPPTTEPPLPEVPAGVDWVESVPPTPFTDPEPLLPTFAEVTATAGLPATPAGYPWHQSDFTIDRWDVADVALVSASCSCWEGGNASGVFGDLRTPVQLFRSVDGGATWAQVDLTAALGNVNGTIDDIVQVDGGLLMQASISDDGRTTPSVVAVLRSVDGSTWERIATLAGEYDGRLSLFGGRFGKIGSNLVLVGGDVVCDFDGSSAVQDVGTVLQTRLWTSVDGGVTWAAQPRADTALDTKPAPPADPTACDGLGIEDRFEQFGIAPRSVSFDGGRVFVWSADGSRIASSTDGLVWSTSALDGASPVPDAGSTSEPAVSSYAAFVRSTGSGWTAMNLERARSADDTELYGPPARSVVVWSSADGATWTREPLGRPLQVEDRGAFSFVPIAAGIGLVEIDTATGAAVRAFTSEPGTHADWARCDAAAGAECAFASEVRGIEPGEDLAGIDLTAVALHDLDLTGVSFAGARLSYTSLSGSVLAGTDFSGADLRLASIDGDVSTAVFAGANLDNAFVSGAFFAADLTGAVTTNLSVALDIAPLPPGVSFAGKDLRGYSFAAYSAIGVLTGVDFSGADLTGVGFAGVDLTGANFAGAITEGMYFSTSGTTTCPDGQPVDETQVGAAACRVAVV